MISNDELKKLAGLSKLYIDDSELSFLAAELSDIVAFADSISELEVESGIDISGYTLDSLREDHMLESQPSEIILENAKHSESGFFMAEVRRHE